VIKLLGIEAEMSPSQFLVSV
jgi:hypothetical protein